jgi:uncharacterized protein (TIGR02246 family)
VKIDEQAIRNVVAQWHDAATAGDVASVLRLMAEDVVFLVAGHPPMIGRDAFAHGFRSVLATHRIASTGQIQEVEVSGDLAYCWASLEVRITPVGGGDTVLRAGNALSILRKQADGSWLVVRDANMLALAS